MKKLLAALMGVIAIALVSCTTLPPPPTNLHIVKPNYVTHIEEMYPVANIIRWENDGKTMWLWVDNKEMPMQCDYVVVYKIIDLEKDMVDLLAMFNFENSVDPCGDAVIAYDEYLDIMKSFPGSQLLPKDNEI